MTDQEVIARLRTAVKKAGGVKAFGALHRISGSYLYDVLRGDRHPGPAIGAALGLTLIRTYRKESNE